MSGLRINLEAFVPHGKGVEPHQADEVVLAPEDPRWRPSEWASMIDADPMDDGVCTRCASNDMSRNPFLVVHAELWNRNNSEFRNACCFAAHNDMIAHVSPEFALANPDAMRFLQSLVAGVGASAAKP